MEPTKAEIKEFLELCGWRQVCPPEKDHYRRGIWETPSGSRSDTPNLKSTDALGLLFQYAVKPNLDGYMMFTGEGGVHFIASKDGRNYEAVAEREEDAIFQAVYPILKEAKK